jgi:hypothetical protein
LIIIAVSKFLDGAWITVIVLPVFVFIFLQIKSHYQAVGRQLSLKGLPPSLRPTPPPRIVIPVSGVHRAIIDAITFAQSLSHEVVAVYVELDPKAWNEWFPDIPLRIVPSPYRSLVRPLLKFLEDYDAEHNTGQPAAIILPEFVPARWWQGLLHNQSAFFLRTALLYSRRKNGLHRRVIIDVPYYLKK